MASLTVGAGQEYTTIHAAVAASHDGDTIYVQAGTYVNDYSEITDKISLVGVGGMVHLATDKAAPNGKGIFVLVADNDITVDHFEFSGATDGSLNGAGIRYQAGNLTITNSYFHDNQEGLLATPDPAHYGKGSITIDHSEFAHNGAGDGYSHNIYIGKIANFTITNSYVHDVVTGHEIKSRAVNTVIENDRIIDGTGTASYSIDIPSRGNAIIENNYIEQDGKSINKIMIRYGEEHQIPQWPESSLLIEDNTIVNKGIRNPIGVVNGAADMTAQMIDNQIYGLTAAEVTGGVGPVSQTGDTMLTSAPIADTSHPFLANVWAGLISGSAAANVLTGTAGNDLFVGNSASDTFVIRAGGGSDTIASFNSPGMHDVVRLEGYSITDFAGVQAAMTQVGANAVLTFANGETLTFLNENISDFSANDFTFASRPSAFTVPTSQGSTTTITADPVTGVATGTDGNDYLMGSPNPKVMQGGAGDDTYNINNVSDVIVENPGGGTDTANVEVASYVLADNVEDMTLGFQPGAAVTGNALDNRIGENSGNDTIDGGAGNDLIWAGTGASVLTGGAGNDMFVFPFVGGLNVITDFHLGEDIVSFSPMMSSADYNGADPVGDHVISLAPDGSGGTLISVDPTRSGTMHAVVDILGIAPTMLAVGAGYGVSGASSLTGVTGFTLADIARPDPFTLALGHGTSGTVKIAGTAGNDYLTGTTGADVMQGGTGDDTYIVNNANDSVVESAGAGTDTVTVQVASYLLPDNVENMTLGFKGGASVTGNSLNNRIAENAANDTIDGGAGNDLIWAGTGASVLTGGAGHDMFVFPTVGGLNTITDFQVGQDLISFTSMMNTAHYNGADPVADHVMSIASDGMGGSLISVDPTRSGTMHAVVDIQGVTPEMLYVGHDILFA